MPELSNPRNSEISNNGFIAEPSADPTSTAALIKSLPKARNLGPSTSPSVSPTTCSSVTPSNQPISQPFDTSFYNDDTRDVTDGLRWLFVAMGCFMCIPIIHLALRNLRRLIIGRQELRL